MGLSFFSFFFFFLGKQDLSKVYEIYFLKLRNRRSVKKFPKNRLTHESYLPTYYIVLPVESYIWVK